MDIRYKDYTRDLKAVFCERVQKISVNGGFSCPNRDGSKGVGGCTYCNNQSFIPDYCMSEKSIRKQLEEGIFFFHHKYQSQKYLAYFQSYTNTYAHLNRLEAIYEEALSVPNVVGIVIGTRPDCIDDDLLDYLEKLSKSKYVMVEYGVESTDNGTLAFINRGHLYEDAEWAIRKTAERGILTGAHLILGLPKENRSEILEHAHKLSSLPLTVLKLHQLQIIKGTKMAMQYETNPEWFPKFSASDYVDLVVDFLERISPTIAVERFVSQSPKELLVSPDWGLKNFEFSVRVAKRLVERDTYQGRLFMP